MPKQVWAVCNGSTTVTGSLTVSASCDGGNSKPLTLDTGANVTINSGVTVSNDAGSGRNGDPVSVLSSSTSASLVNNGTISTGSQWGITVNGVLTGLINTGTISSGTRRAVVIQSGATISTFTNTGTLSGPFSDITTTGTLTTFNNLQGVGNAGGAVTNSVNSPVNYNIIINDTSHYGQLDNSGASGSMAFNIYGNTGTTLVSGVDASSITVGTYTDVLQGFTNLDNVTGTVGIYGIYSYSLVADSDHAGYWNLAVVTASSVSSGTTASTSNIGLTVLPKMDGGTLQVASAGTISTALTITTNNGTIDQHGLASTFSGIISNDTFGQAGKLYITNSGSGGSVTLDAANTYSGGTEVGVGATLAIASGNALGSGSLALVGSDSSTATLQTTATTTITNAITVAGDPTFDVAPSTTTTISSAITDGGTPGDVVVQGGGTLVLNAANTYTGITSVQDDSTLVVGDESHTASITSNTTVDSGSSLRGYGTITGNVINNGTVNPGTATTQAGTLSVNGNFSQTTGAINFYLTPTAHSQLNISGTATLGGNLTATITSGTYDTNTIYHLITAGNIVLSSLDTTSITNNAIGMTNFIRYTATGVDLIFIPNTPQNTNGYQAVTTVGLNAAQRNFGTIFSQINNARSNHEHSAQANIEGNKQVQLAFAGSDYQLGDIFSSVSDAVTRNGGWFKTIGSLGNINQQNGISGFYNHAMGFLAGIDRQVTDKAIVGVAVGYSHTDINQQDATGSANMGTPRISLYGNYALNSFDLASTIGYANSNIKTTRAVTSLTAVNGSYHAQEWNAALQASRFIYCHQLQLIPSIGMQYVHIANPAYTEEGIGGNQISSYNATSLQPFIGLNLSRIFTSVSGMILTPEARLGFRHEMLSSNNINIAYLGNNFTANGIKDARNIASFGAGVNLKLTKKLAAFIDYNADLYLDRGNEQTFSLGLRYAF